MKPLSLLITPFALTPIAWAQGPLVDINATAPLEPTSSSPTEFVTFGSKTFFAADVPGLGRELCVVENGQASVVADIVLGLESSDPADLRVAGGYLWFSAYTLQTGRELWRSDGTASGTELVADLLPGTANGNPREFVEFAGAVFFSAATAPGKFFSSGSGGLWRTDGTTAGTTVVTDFGLGSEERPEQLTEAGGLLYFLAGTSSVELWRTDGTVAGTLGLFGSGLSNPGELVESNGQLFFLGTQFGIGPTTEGLWTTDGQTVQPLTLFGNPVLPNPGNLTAWNGDLYFTAWDAQFDRVLLKSDGTPGNLTQLTVPPGTFSPSFSEFAPAQSFLAFVHNDPVNGSELWRTDGTLAGTVVIDDLAPGVTSSNIAQVTALGDRVVFRANDDSGSGLELYVSDGQGIDLVADIAPSANSFPSEFYSDGNVVWFAADDPVAGREPFTTDGTPGGTALAADAAVTPASVDTEFREFARLGDKVVFVADDGVHGMELWVTDGTAGGTGLVIDAVPGPNGSGPRDLTVLGDYVYYIVTAVDLTFIDKIEVWKTDGTLAGTGPITNLFDAGWFDPEGLRESGGRLFFSADSPTLGREPWISDGTFGGTQFLADTNPSPSSFATDGVGLDFTPVDGGWVFRVDGPSFNDFSLWFTDGTTVGTVPLDDGDVSFPENPVWFVQLNDEQAVFRGQTSAIGTGVFVTDGTTAGTKLLIDFVPGADSPVNLDFFPVGERIVIRVQPQFGGAHELWTTDGTVAGTKKLVQSVLGTPFFAGEWGDQVVFVANSPDGSALLITDGTTGGSTAVFDPTVASPFASVADPLVGSGDYFYFGVRTGFGDTQLWRTDGTDAGTIFLADAIDDGAFSEGFAIGSGNEMLFAGSDELGREVWRSRGTPSTTERLLDVESGAADSDPEGFLRAGLNVVFTATEQATGLELYSLPLASIEASVLEPFGSGCPGSGGAVPAMAVDGPAQLGDVVTIGVEDAFPVSTAFLFVSLNRADLPLTGDCVQYIGDPVTLLAPALTDGTGAGAVALPIAPDFTALTYLPLYFQYVVADPGGPFAGATLSDGLEVIVGPAD